MSMIASQIVIDPDFKALIPPLTDQERAQLEQNIIDHGCRDPLVLWDAYTVPGFLADVESAALKGGKVYCKYCAEDRTVSYGDGIIVCDECDHGLAPVDIQRILLDGHNRYEICERLGVHYDTITIDLPDREAALDWIDANQLGRRNLSPDQFKVLLGRRYNRQKRQGRRTDLTSGQSDQKSDTATTLAERHSVSEKTVRRAGKDAELLAARPEDEKAVLAGKTTITQVKRKAREEKREQRRTKNAERVSKVADPIKAQAKFSTIVIDPPWDWGDEGDINQMGRAKPDYATMSIADLTQLPVGDLSDDDAHIYLWITNRSLPKGFALLDAWGYRYITTLTWPKPSFGMGNYFRGQTEHVLFGVKGSQMLSRKNASTLLPAWARGPQGHSSKPVEFAEFVESCSPGPYLEMFARSERNGWHTWGESS